MTLSIYSFDPDERIARVAYALHSEGRTEREIASVLHVSLTTYRRKKDKLMAMFATFDKEGSATYIEERDRKQGKRVGIIKLTEEKKKQAVELSAFGCTIAQICKFLRITQSTLYKVFKDDPGFYLDVRDARVVADIEVFQAMRKKATGYKTSSTMTTTFTDANGRTLNQSRQRTVRNIAPSDKMIQFMMINRHGWSNHSDKEPEDHDKQRTEYDVRRNLYSDDSAQSEERDTAEASTDSSSKPKSATASQKKRASKDSKPK